MSPAGGDHLPVWACTSPLPMPEDPGFRKIQSRQTLAMSLTGRGSEHIPTCFSQPVSGAEPVAYIYSYPKVLRGCGHVGWSILGELRVSIIRS